MPADRGLFDSPPPALTDELDTVLESGAAAARTRSELLLPLLETAWELSEVLTLPWLDEAERRRLYSRSLELAAGWPRRTLRRLRLDRPAVVGAAAGGALVTVAAAVMVARHGRSRAPLPA
ncbi:MAG: hypothetical protein E6J14_01280 [Chloroflexi bacterium]|nr:MAG: hypothetical protein E6J14_01280 [Chloroflexota bacterium]